MEEAAEKLKILAVQKRLAKIVNKPVIPRFEPNMSVAEDNPLISKACQEITKAIEELTRSRDSMADLLQRGKNLVEVDWDNKKLEIVPGDELIDLVCREFETRFIKEKDSVRLASMFKADEVPQEIKEIITDICRWQFD